MQAISTAAATRRRGVGAVMSAAASTAAAISRPSWFSDPASISVMGVDSVQNSSARPRRATCNANTPSAANAARLTMRAITNASAGIAPTACANRTPRAAGT